MCGVNWIHPIHFGSGGGLFPNQLSADHHLKLLIQSLFLSLCFLLSLGLTYCRFRNQISACISHLPPRSCPCAQLSTTSSRCMENWSYSSTILDLYTRWRWVVSFTPRLLYPRYVLDRRLSRPQSRYGRCGEEKNFLPLLGIEPCSLSLYRLSLPGLGPTYLTYLIVFYFITKTIL
jgi:hypothetical protein